MFCPQCGNQSATHSAPHSFCSSCGAATPSHVACAAQSSIVRPRHPRMLAGVCSGIAIHFGWDIALVRMTFAVLAFMTTGAAILFYLAAWVILPEAQYAIPPAPHFVNPGNMGPGTAA